MRQRLVALISAGTVTARHFGGRAWAGIRSIKRPRTVREYAIWGGWSVGGMFAVLAGL